jgi:hypothetical protein
MRVIEAIRVAPTSCGCNPIAIAGAATATRN